MTARMVLRAVRAPLLSKPPSRRLRRPNSSQWFHFPIRSLQERKANWEFLFPFSLHLGDHESILSRIQEKIRDLIETDLRGIADFL